jgi:hypothetical protein
MTHNGEVIGANIDRTQFILVYLSGKRQSI